MGPVFLVPVRKNCRSPFQSRSEKYFDPGTILPISILSTPSLFGKQEFRRTDFSSRLLAAEGEGWGVCLKWSNILLVAARSLRLKSLRRNSCYPFILFLWKVIRNRRLSGYFLTHAMYVKGNFPFLSVICIRANFSISILFHLVMWISHSCLRHIYIYSYGASTKTVCLKKFECNLVFLPEFQM